MAANHMILIFLLMFLTSVSATNNTSRSQDILQAIEEMRRANYFTFVMLIHMAPADLIQGGITFLMPKDKTIAQTSIPENDVADFLLRHSIPSPLLFDHLQHFPTGSMIPTSKADLVLKVNNSGNMHFFLNNARIISPNICTRSASIRCHGIDQVLETTTLASDHNATVPVPPPCHNVTSPPSGLAASPPVMSPASAAQPVSSSINLIPSPSPPLKSGVQSPLALSHAGITGQIWLLVALSFSLYGILGFN